MDVQPLPQRPGAMAVRPKGQVTAGRPLPPYPGEAATAAAAPPPVTLAPTVVAAAPAPVAAAAPPPVIMRPSKPDARPMRLAFGAGAVAAMSVMAVGFVQPDFGEAAEQPAETSDAVALDTSTDANGVRVRVRHVTKYVFLEPGERAPRGATVISPQEAGDRTPKKRRPTTRKPKPAAPAVNEPAPRPKAPVTTRQSG